MICTFRYVKYFTFSRKILDQDRSRVALQTVFKRTGGRRRVSLELAFLACRSEVDVFLSNRAGPGIQSCWFEGRV
jgi:hypothetical protein